MSTEFTVEGERFTAHRDPDDPDMLVVTCLDSGMSFSGRCVDLPRYEPVFVVPDPEPYSGIGPVLDGQVVAEPGPDPEALPALDVEEGSL
ncbi:hypothetical protein [Rhodococcus sp. KRD162]|uniref:hypothetical protein n=1 Tax=Rhodococcus sp. KRD162 TaxID=2729725 RepID=UPI0019CFBC5F|nr:hypothetical protein [Rhodococcus sp. KRD162]